MDGDLQSLQSAIKAALEEKTGGPVEVERVTQLFGGACQDNYRVDVKIGAGPLAGPRRLVLRSDAKSSIPGSLGRKQEYAVIQAAVARGVKTPAVHALIADLVRPGAFAYFMDFVPGEAIGAKIVRDPTLAAAREKLPDELAAVLAKIHSLTPAAFPDLLDSKPIEDPARAAIAAQYEILDRAPEPHPALELALRWASDHIPRHRREVTLVHGDFRTGNFMVTPEGLSGVLDWEFARWGDPLEDVAWLCVRDWRFGQLDRAAGGICKRERFYQAYARASGREVEPEVVRFWEIMGNVRWALGAMWQGLRYLQGGEVDLELISIARRAAEMEFEALRLIEGAEKEA